MTSLIFMLIDGIQGESTERSHKGWMDVLSFTHSITVPLAGGIGAGGVGRAQETFSVTRQMDSTSPQLYNACAMGKHIKSVTMDFMRVTDNLQVKNLSVEMQDVIISGTTTTIDAGGLPVDRLSLTYAKIAWIPIQPTAA